MSKDKEPNIPSEPSGESGKMEKGYKNYLNFLKETKNSKISTWFGKASDIYGEIKKAAPELHDAHSIGIVAPDAVISEGVLIKAVELARMEWIKAKLESEDPVDLSEQYNSRMARLNDEYHHKNVLFTDVSIVGFMRDKDSNADRLLVTRDQEETRNQVFAVDPRTGVVVEVFHVTTRNCLVALRRST
jgi:hypothetical protein